MSIFIYARVRAHTHTHKYDDYICWKNKNNSILFSFLNKYIYHLIYI